MKSEHQPIWARAHPYLQTRSNDTHTLYCYYFVQQLLQIHTEANPEVVLPAMLLHDVGWSTVPEDKQLLSFGPNMQYPDLRRQHETEGAHIAASILSELEFTPELTAEIVSIIDGHDTRKASLSLNDSLVKDADKLWRYTPFGLETVSAWFGYTIPQQLQLLEKWLGYRFYTETAVHMARGLLASLFMNHHHHS
ncbi:MAG: HD domain-containing protein [Chloroflexi bacterium]|nr:HD domain-containing protein [Chloroflexota bacterium]